MFDFKQFFLKLTQDQRAAFAAAAGTSVAYIGLHLIHGRRVPRPALMHRLCRACADHGATPTVPDLAAFFFQAGAGEAAGQAAAAPPPDAAPVLAVDPAAPGADRTVRAVVPAPPVVEASDPGSHRPAPAAEVASGGQVDLFQAVAG